MGRVKVPASWAVVGQVQGTDGQHGTHDVVAAETQLDDIVPPELPQTWISREGGVCFCCEVVEKLKLDERQLLALREDHQGRVGRRGTGRRDGGL